MSHARACRILQINRTNTYYKKIMPSKDEPLYQLISNVVGTSRKGRNKVIALVQRNRPELSSSRLRRIYENSGLSLYKRPKRRIKNQTAQPLQIPLAPMREIAMDFMSDCLEDGRRIRILNVIDHYNRKCLGTFVAYRMPATVVLEALSRVIDLHGRPHSIRTDNGPEFISKRFRLWLHLKGIHHVRIQPGKPAQNGIIERFNRTYREELLDANLFYSLENAQQLADEFKYLYNSERPHESLYNQTPEAYAA